MCGYICSFVRGLGGDARLWLRVWICRCFLRRKRKSACSLASLCLTSCLGAPSHPCEKLRRRGTSGTRASCFGGGGGGSTNSSGSMKRRSCHQTTLSHGQAYKIQRESVRKSFSFFAAWFFSGWLALCSSLSRLPVSLPTVCPLWRIGFRYPTRLPSFPRFFPRRSPLPLPLPLPVPVRRRPLTLGSPDCAPARFAPPPPGQAGRRLSRTTKTRTLPHSSR